MATTSLAFTKNAKNRWEAKYTSTGTNVAVQVQAAIKEGKGASEPLVVYANLPGMNPVAVQNLGGSTTGMYLFEVDMPEGIEVTIESMGEVTSAKITG